MKLSKQLQLETEETLLALPGLPRDIPESMSEMDLLKTLLATALHTNYLLALSITLGKTPQ